MKKFSSFFIVIVTCTTIVSVSGCSNSILNESEITGTVLNSASEILCSSEEIILGAKRNNPFNISNSRNINTKANYVYFRVRTNILENIDLIEKNLGDLNTEPLDYEIKEGGCSFDQNKGTDGFSPWFYSMTPLEKYNEIKDLGETEIIEKMYLSDEDVLKLTEIDDAAAEAESRILWISYKKVKPCGHIYFHDEVKNLNTPLRNVKVTVSQWCHVKSVYTDDNGYYDIGENFTSCWQNTANIKITFESKTDSIYDEFAVAKAYYKTGDVSISDLRNNDITFSANTKQNNYSVMINSATEYRKYAKEDGITQPSNIKFWACTQMSGGLTLMQDVIIADSAFIGSVIGTGILPGAGTAIGTLTGATLATYFPDIFISLQPSNRTQTEKITEIVFHEMAHASHFFGIGAGAITYWNKEYLEMLDGWCEVLANGGSVQKDCYNNGESKQVCHIESWAYFYGYLLTKRYFEGFNSYYNYHNVLLDEDNKRDDYYFYYPAFYILYTKKILSISQIFAPYRKYLVQSASNWYDSLNDIYDSLDFEEIKKTLQDKGASL